MTPQEKRKSSINACIEDVFAKVPKLIVDMTKTTAYAISDALGCVDTGACAVFFDEEDCLVEIVFPYDSKRLTVEYDVITGKFKVYRSKIGEHQEFKYDSALEDTVDHVAWLLGMHPAAFNFGMYKGQNIGMIISSNPKYVKWCVENVSGFKEQLSKEEEKTLIKNLDSIREEEYHRWINTEYSEPRDKAVSKVRRIEGMTGATIEATTYASGRYEETVVSLNDDNDYDERGFTTGL